MIESICIFGDSIMKGVIFDAIKGRYIFLKNSFLNILGMRNTNIKVDNYAKFGCTITVGKKLIEKHSSELPGYEYTALEFGGNDCDFDWKAISENPDALHIPKTPIDEFEKNYSEIIDRVASTGSKPVLFSLPPLNARRYFSWISRGLNADNILRWLGDEEHIYRWHEMYNIAVLKLAAAKNVTLIDIRRAFLETRDYLSLLCEDGIHPNEAGHALISEAIRKSIPSLA
jgi:acyl-CoA thioesterase-1